MKKLTFNDKLGYGFAAAGDTITYILVNTFIVFYLTTVSGIQPALAGTLTAIGAVWNAIFNPIIGYISDHSRTKLGRRRPYMFGFCLPLVISISLLFTTPDLSYNARVIYYGILIIAFWTSYTGFFVPYYALGAQYTSDYDERTVLRSFASLFNTIGTTISMALPVSLVHFIQSRGVTQETSWTVTASLIAAVGGFCIILTAVAAKDKDPALAPQSGEQRDKLSLKNMASEYVQVLKLKPMRWLLVCSLFCLIAYAMFASNLIYYLTFNIGLSSHAISLSMLFRCGICILIITPVAKLCKLTDRRTALLIMFLAGSIGCVAMRFCMLPPIFMVACIIIFSVLITTTYWQIVPSMFYDVCDYDELVTGHRREGAILSIQGLVEGIASGIGTQILGLILQFSNFNGDLNSQCDTALNWIYNCATWVPVLFLSVSVFALIKYPLKRSHTSQF